jgi:alpha-beta hydrolase superfamily lysophospholipase/ubiquinone/menaquinone biosynthesis C-methylase UbiE
METNGTTWTGEIVKTSSQGCTICIDGDPPISHRPSLKVVLSLHNTTHTFSAELLTKREKKITAAATSPLLNLLLDIRVDNFHEIFRLRELEAQAGFQPNLSFQFSRQETSNLVQDWVSTDFGGQRASVSHQVTQKNGPSSKGTLAPFRTLTQSPLTPTHSSTPIKTHQSSDIKVHSARISCLNQHGHEIVGYHDFSLLPDTAHVPVVILSPGYGETKREYITLAYHLATNGFHVIRYDHTRHVGDSEGTHAHTTLTSIKDDMDTMVNFVKSQWGDVPLALVATSLAGRAALKLVAESNKIDFLILIAGIVNVQKTLNAVHQEDLVGEFQEGIRRGVTNILGFNVEADQWLQDSLVNEFATLDSTIRDVRQLQVPILWFCGEQDTWVTREDMCAVRREVKNESFQSMVIPDGLHRLLENPKKARAVYREIVSQCRTLRRKGSWETEIQDPSRRAIGIQNRLEREASKTNSVLPSSHLRHFWQDYLEHFHTIAHVGDYRQLLDQVYQSLAIPNQPIKILDAGCGNGTLAHFISMRQIWNHQKRHHPPAPIQYVGLDFVSEALQGASKTFLQETPSEGESHESPLPSSGSSTSFLQANLNQPLPFQDGQFDRVVSNLVIGYLENISSTVNEMFRVLAPGGTLVLTNLKPNSDLTQIYRNYVDQTESRQDIEEGRHLLSNSGKIRQAESEGLFHFYEKEEWQSVFEECGIQDFHIHTTFADQAFVAVAKKPCFEIKPQPASMKVSYSQDAA